MVSLVDYQLDFRKRYFDSFLNNKIYFFCSTKCLFDIGYTDLKIKFC